MEGREGGREGGRKPLRPQTDAYHMVGSLYYLGGVARRERATCLESDKKAVKVQLAWGQAGSRKRAQDEERESGGNEWRREEVGGRGRDKPRQTSQVYSVQGVS